MIAVSFQLVRLHPSLSSASMWGLMVALPLIIILALCVYRRIFHPLAKYPGPWLGGITSAYGAYHSAKGDLHLDILRCHKQYGPIVRYSPNRLIFRSTQALQDIYGFGSTLPKSSSYRTMVPWKDGWTAVTCIDRSLHKHMRRTLQSGLSPRGLRAFEESSVRNIETLITILNSDATPESKGWSQPKDMTTLVKCLAIDSMGLLAYGRPIGLLAEPSIRYIVSIFDFYTLRTGFFEQWPRLWFTGIETLVAQLGQHFSSTSDKFSAWRKEYTEAAIDSNNETRMGVFSSVARLSVDDDDGDDGDGDEYDGAGSDRGKGIKKERYQYSRAQMEAEGSFILLAAGDSNGTSLSAAFFYLSRYPEVHAKLAAELRGKFPPSSAEGISSGRALDGCVYLAAVIAEVLRIHPPSPGVLWREAVGRAGGGAAVVIDGVSVPDGTDVGVCVYAMHHREDVFREPERFWPERWIAGTLPEEELRRANAACKPFSLGLRSCAGQAVAMNELKLVLGKIVHRCDFRPATGELGRIGEGREGDVWGRTNEKVFQFRAHFTAMTEGPWLEFRLR